jgi:site-specific DNA-methyltransferase (adenine-specific)
MSKAIIPKMILTQGECLAEMAEIPDAYVDMVLCDLPYGTTQNKWDSIIDLTQLWAAYKRICKPGAAIVLTAAQPFTSVLVCSNLKDFKYQWVWRKENGTGFLNAKKRPLPNHEDVLVFWSGSQGVYNPQMRLGFKPYTCKQGASGSNYGKVRDEYVNSSNGERFPLSVLDFARDAGKVHPTQKPVALMEYMIKTYTDPGMMVLDNCMGSGTTGVACMNLGRAFVGIERDPAYFKIASERIAAAQKLVAAVQRADGLSVSIRHYFERPVP